MKKLIFIFPGQGSQNKEMIEDLYSKFQIIRNTINYSSNILKYNILKIIKIKNKINKTFYLQPILSIINVAIWRLWNQKNCRKPNIFIGHSLGEYTTLICNNTITLKNGIVLIKKRAELMQIYSKKLSMIMLAIVGINYEKLIKIIFDKKKLYKIEIININSKRQIIISIKKSYLKKFKNLLQINKIKYFVIKTDAISHNKFLIDMAKKYKIFLQTYKLNNLKKNIIHNININYSKKTRTIIELLVKHLYKKIKWIETSKYIEFTGIINIIECGPNKILTNLSKKTSKIEYKSINNAHAFKENIQKY